MKVKGMHHVDCPRCLKRIRWVFSGKMLPSACVGCKFHYGSSIMSGFDNMLALLTPGLIFLKFSPLSWLRQLGATGVKVSKRLPLGVFRNHLDPELDVLARLRARLPIGPGQ